MGGYQRINARDGTEIMRRLEKGMRKGRRNPVITCDLYVTVTRPSFNGNESDVLTTDAALAFCRATS